MKYGIIGAMEEEIQWLLSKMDVQQEYNIANRKFYEGKIADQEVVLLQSGIGKVNAALTTAILHETFKPDFVINTGSAGGTDPNLNVGDIVVGYKIVHHDADATAFGYEYGQIPQMPKHFQSNDDLIKVSKKAIQQVDDSIQVVEGMIGTGDSFMSDHKRVSNVLERIPEVKALEMEAAAIAQVSYQYDTPFIIIRSLSDIAGRDSDVSFEQYLEKAAKNSANLIVNMLELTS
ncbi:5'-methylthioadenosine/adenosylhomocysteine nucleosidase [Tenuibacillus multivorans]|uniref:5'-methylthioadenosine/S-adenosylhomocysteine nucleosidase n=1 Tax=Tenuibacillus multivorans TaxID=237069 RepID=A0A1G9ZIZ3_9BACI|nr:5'-methylthioadenosine/adenosylhomocysteine nucleosidase [Tenuibacillus multivorans]GEL77507.1 5'-methylthioadenosine/S-adenosylhomocysteine nucleosidase [Tenuibacillus multivorans]SDN20546.1 adenosylhomocysteine nucleosidase [Tenuibacillus multivorans]